MVGLGETATGQKPITGEAVSDLEAFDRLGLDFITKNEIPGASLTVSHQGKQVYSRGFGYADVENREAVQPDSLFRVASVSKPFTGVAILQLWERGKLKLDDKVMKLMKIKPYLSEGKDIDPRWHDITVRHCLQHIGGWHRGRSYDPIGKHFLIAKVLDVKFPVKRKHIIRYMMGKKLDFDPGAEYAYSNLGYLVLGEIIQELTGMSYENYVKKKVFAPLGIKTAKLGRATLENRAKGEVRYYDRHNRFNRCVYPPNVGKRVPIQYGHGNFEAYGAHGGWIASTPDLVKFASAFDNPKKCRILTEKSIQLMWDRPPGALSKDKEGKPRKHYYGCGWTVYNNPGKGINAWHSGLITGTEAMMVRRYDGIDWAVVFNTSIGPKGGYLSSMFDREFNKVARQIKKWP